MVEVGLEVVGEDLEVQGDFDRNNHLILDCSNQCNPLVVDCCNHIHCNCNHLVNYHWRRSALNSAGALVQGGDGEFRGFFTPYHKFSGIV